MFMRWLLDWQHVAPGTQTSGERGTLEVAPAAAGLRGARQRVGAASARRRIGGYDPAVLDQLCLTGAVGWGRLSPHPATLETAPAGRRARA